MPALKKVPASYEISARPPPVPNNSLGLPLPSSHCSIVPTSMMARESLCVKSARPVVGVEHVKTLTLFFFFVDGCNVLPCLLSSEEDCS